MKHVLAAARFAGLSLSDLQIDRLETYRDWLATEAVPAGGIGPAESGRLEQRHLADSILFLAFFPSDVGSVWDLGSGAGLPGIPLAICAPEVQFRLIDRSGRRADLLRRAIRILGLENCSVEQTEISSLAGRTDVVVSRASLPPSQLAGVAARILHGGGRAIVAGSWRERPSHPGWDTVEIPAEVLDQPVWFLIMHPA